MSTIKSFEDLQELGASSIHERTHISRVKVEQVLDKSFDQLNRVQFMGFISILEREYGINLESLRSEYDSHKGFDPEMAISKPSAVLQASSNTRTFWIFGAIGVIVILMLLGSMMQGELSVAPKEEVLELSSAAIEVVDTNFSEMNTSDVNATNDMNITEINTTQLMQEQNKSMATLDPEGKALSFYNVLSIKPSSKVWVGMMDLETGKKIQKVTKDPILIDSTKSWLFIFGHGRLEIVTSSGSKILKERNTVWFTYENGSLQQLTAEEFKIKNKGSSW
ncbi:MAG: hypothetical protein Q8R58_12160 [Sulfuricurvum sp.]|nr:hypothetical protein [Sulfuricurvum sp.]